MPGHPSTNVDIAGARGRFDKDAFLKAHARGAVALDADMVCGREHIASAIEHARRAFKRGTNTARSLELEVVLYAAGETQLSVAIDLMDVRGDKVALVVFEGQVDELLQEMELSRDDSVIAPETSKALRLGVPRTMLDTVGENRAQDLVLEKVALVDLEKRAPFIREDNQA